ncbi:MAG: NAD(P)/FAD-dependent oxidoreductase, partial [Phycisphaerales bacterium]
MTVSYWRRGVGLGEISVDVCVVGGGIAGLSAMVWLERRGVRAVLLERHAIGHGASSRNAGFLMRGAAENYAEAVRLHGRERAREVWRLTEENLALLRAEGVEALGSYRRVPSCLVAFDEAEAKQLRGAVGQMREDGFEAAWVESGTDTMWTRASPLGGLVNPHDGSCNPVELLGLLRGKLGSPVFEHQEVMTIE